MKYHRFCSLLTLLALFLAGSLSGAESWKRHTIDRSSRGADGVRLADANGDGLPDIATGWEQGGVIRVYLHPGKAKSKQPWPAVTVGRVKSAEDAVFADLDGDGRLDVVSCCEGRTKTVFIHWAPTRSEDYLDATKWKTEPLPVTAGKQAWMYALPMQVDGQHGTDLVVGSKGRNATVGWLEAPKDPRNVKGWRFHSLYQAGWIMSMLKKDMDGDGDSDVIVSDRKGKSRGILWLQNPGSKANRQGSSWREHRIGGTGLEVMFLTVADLNRDRHDDIVCATRNDKLLILLGQKESGKFRSHSVANPFGIKNGKAVAVGDIDLDGKPDLVHNTNKGSKSKPQPALVWMKQASDLTSWQAHDVSGPQGVKFDLIELLDLDGDGDLDILTCEEAANLGVFWYENPTR